MRDLGTYERHGDHIDVRFERHYPRPPEKVWRALTDPERLADWMGLSHVEPHVGGRFETMLDGIKPMRGEVLVWDPPKALELHWSNEHAPDSTVRYELTPEADGTRLIFTHRHMPHATCALMLPGWHVFFARLGQALEDEEPPDWVTRWRQMQTVYIEHYGLGHLQLDP
ncbi:SRPBCC family protein [Devosia sp. CN2-171]|uniref:SRPBCC family protein n=1 Tax=Devosia sp. CN2-171 TaxID=3400909 RepID=UPI003BF81C3F